VEAQPTKPVKRFSDTLATWSDKKNLIQFFAFQAFPEKNGDQEFFGFVQIYRYKTWCFFTQRQLDIVKCHFPIEENTFPDQPYGGFHFGKQKAFEKKIYFNLSILFRIFPEKKNLENYPANVYFLDCNFSSLSVFKKNYPLLNLAMDDKQEVFYEKTPLLSYLNATNFRFPLFNCGFTQGISQKGSFSELTESLCLGVNEAQKKIINKFIALNWIKKDSSFEIDFFFLAMIKFVNTVFGADVVATLIQNGVLIKMTKNKYLRQYNNVFLSECDIYFTFVKLFEFLKSENLPAALTFLEKWDFESGFHDPVNHFLKYLTTCKANGLQFQMDKYSSPKYLFHVLSKEMNKLTKEDFKLKPVKMRKQFQDYEIVIPKTYKTLMKWGAWLHNCAGNLEQRDYYKKSISIGLFKDGQIEYLASIERVESSKRLELTQLKGFKNKSPTYQMFKDFIDTLKEQGLIDQECKPAYERCCKQRI
jgi:hypothetical protein